MSLLLDTETTETPTDWDTFVHYSCAECEKRNIRIGTPVFSLCGIDLTGSEDITDLYLDAPECIVCILMLYCPTCGARIVWPT